MSRKAEIMRVLVKLWKLSTIDLNPENEVLITFLKDELGVELVREYIKEENTFWELETFH